MTEEERAKLLEEGKSEVEIIQLEKIAEMKEKMDNMVDPEKFKKLEADYKKLLDDFTNRRPTPKKEEPNFRPTKEVAEELKTIKDGDITNRDYIEKALEYRESHIAEFGKDPFTNFGINGSEESTATTNKVAGTLKQLLKDNPTPTGFRIALNETLRDDPNVLKMLAAKAKKKK